MHKADAEMKRAAKLAGYERRQFEYAAHLWKHQCGLRSGTARDDLGRSAVIEVLLLHARVLREFFTNSRKKRRNNPEKPAHPLDILAQDFFDNPGLWMALEPALKAKLSYLTPVRTKKRLDR